jgi:hypothetical protein
VTEDARTKGNWLLVAIWAAALLSVFVAFRFGDLLRLPTLLGNLGGGPLFGGDGILGSLVGIAIAGLILLSWYGFGSFVFRHLRGEDIGHTSRLFEITQCVAAGAVVTSLIWFLLGYFGLYLLTPAIVLIVIGSIEGVLSLTRLGRGTADENPTGSSGIDKVLFGLILIPIILALVSSLAPPTAKDTLLYHFSLPKQFIAQGSNAFVEGNIASYLSLGGEMHVVWARLLGGFVSDRAAEAAGGAVLWFFFPLLIAAVYGWAREVNISRTWSLVAALMIAAIPTAYHVAANGYVDLALSLFVVLAAHSLLNWLRTGERRTALLMGVFLGGALSIKLTTIFVIAAFVLVVLLNVRGGGDSQAGSLRSDVAAGGLLALVLAGAIASPWYLRTWAETGSPVFPFYMSIWKGKAKGWDVERSDLFQGMNAQYGGGQDNPTNYLISPARVSLAAQPEDAGLYDGVIGAMFLIGLPLVLWAAWKGELADGIGYLLIIAGVVYLFWLFSSAQIRYLLPILPLIAIAIAAAADRLNGGPMRSAGKYSLVAASVICVFTSLAWFSMKAPLRVALGGEDRDAYLTRNIDYYPYYAWLNTESDRNERAWLINTRRDTYHIDRPVLSDYIFEDWTLRQMVWEAQNIRELREKVASLGVNYILTRHDFLFNYDRSTLVDDKKPRGENEAKLRLARELILDPARTIKADHKFSLVRVDR